MQLFCFLIALVCLTVVKTGKLTSAKTWNEFKETYNKQYGNIEEENYRRNIFNQRVAMIRRHNSEAKLGLHSYTMKINQFADMKREELREKLSNKVPTNFDRKISSQFNEQIFHPSSDRSIPATVDWRKKGAVLSLIENQGQCGSDWAFTAKAALEGQHFLKTGELVRLSAQNLVDCSSKFGNRGCNGGLVNAAYQYIKINKGIDTEESYPYEAMDGKCRFNQSSIGATDRGFVNIPKGNETALQIAIATIGPIAMAVDDLHESFYFYESGVYDEPACSTTDWSHTMTIVGYDTFNNGTTKRDYYNVKNTWGETWGWQGYIWMSRNKNNQCGIANWASYPLV